MNVHRGGAGVLGGVRDGFGDDEVGGGPDGLRQLCGDVVGDVHGEGAALCHLVESVPQTEAVQGGRVDAPGDLTQLCEQAGGLCVGLGQEIVVRGSCGLAASAGPSEKHGEGDEALLDAVVQIAFDAAPFGVDGLDDGGAAGGEFFDAQL